MKLKNSNKKYFIWQLLIYLVISFLFICPWVFSHRIWCNYDMLFHLNRIQDVYVDTIHNQFHWLNTMDVYGFKGRGYPVNLFYPVFTLIPAGILMGILHNPVAGFYIYLILITLLTLYSAYYVGAKLFKNRWYANLFAILFAFSQYRIIDIYSRGALAEGITFIFVPLVFYGALQIAHGDYHQWYILSIGMTLIAYTHVLSIMLSSLLVFMTLFAFFLKPNHFWERLKSLIYSVILTTLLAGNFIFPLIQQLKYTKISVNESHILGLEADKLPALIRNSFHSSFSQYQTNIGLVAILLTILALFAFVWLSPLFKFILIEGLVTLWFATQSFPWHFFQHILASVQFPWRFLEPATFLLLLAGVAALQVVFGKINIPQILKYAVIIALPLITVYTGITSMNIGLSHPGDYHLVPYSNKNYSVISDTSKGAGNRDYADKANNPVMRAIMPRTPHMHIKAINKQKNKYITYEHRDTDGTNLTYKIVAKRNVSHFKLPVAFYYGMQTAVNTDKSSFPQISSDRLINVNLKKGTNHIKISYHKTSVQLLSTVISVMAWLFVLVYWLKSRYDKRHANCYFL